MLFRMNDYQHWKNKSGYICSVYPEHHSIVNFKDDWLLLPYWCWAYSIVWNKYEDLYISLGIRATSATLLGLWESRGGYCVLFSWNWYSNSSSPLCLVSICPLPANLPQGISGMDLEKSMQEGRLFIFNSINNLPLWKYITPHDDTALSYGAAVRNTTQN